jgi:NADH:ubiquinone oxidoreductase subunit 2 (subunit N)
MRMTRIKILEIRNQLIKNILTVIIGAIIIAAMCAVFIVMYDTALFLYDEYYDKHTLILNIIFYVSPVIALLQQLANEDPKWRHRGFICILVYTGVFDVMYLISAILRQPTYYQWLYILPAAIITIINYLLLKMSRDKIYCPHCNKELEIKHPFICDGCETDVVKYVNKNKQAT